MSSAYTATDLQRRKMHFALEEAYQMYLPLAKENIALAVVTLRHRYAEIWRTNCPNEYRACHIRVKSKK